MQKPSIFRNIVRIATLQGVMAIFLLLMTSCDRNASQIKFTTLQGEGWRASDTLHLTVDSLPESGDYEFSVALRTSSAVLYPYREIVMEVCREWQPSGKRQTDTLTCWLAAEDGEGTGRGVALYSFEFPVDTLQLPSGESGHVSLRHLMRRSPLPGICQVGFFLQKHS